MKRSKDMRQKYVISRNDAQKKLKISEYAIIDKDLKQVSPSMLQKEDFSLLCEETYESKIIVSCASKGMNALVAALQTHNMFPIEAYSTKIAESVMELYNSSEDGSVELFFDDLDLLSV
jgi:protease II